MNGYQEEGPDADEELAQAVVPNEMKTIRACKRCGLLKTLEQFHDYGCENCPFMKTEDHVGSNTTAFFEGQVAVTDPRSSWAAKWIRVDGFMPGVYAITVTGDLDQEVKDDLVNQGIQWRCRPATKS